MTLAFSPETATHGSQLAQGKTSHMVGKQLLLWQDDHSQPPAEEGCISLTSCRNWKIMRVFSLLAQQQIPLLLGIRL